MTNTMTQAIRLAVDSARLLARSAPAHSGVRQAEAPPVRRAACDKVASWTNVMIPPRDRRDSPGSVVQMSTRATIKLQFEQVAREQQRRLEPLSDDLNLLDSGLDSLSFALIVARLEDALGFDPFDTDEPVQFPVTLAISSGCTRIKRSSVSSQGLQAGDIAARAYEVPTIAAMRPTTPAEWEFRPGPQTEEPLYFRAADRQLFGWLHRGAAVSANHAKGRASAMGVVICKPFGYEATCAHRSLGAFAQAAAAAGFPTLRFDYAGTGDSGKIDATADQL